MTKEIELTQDKVALVDDADYEWLNQWNWCAHKKPSTYYAVRNIRQPEPRMISMHREILELKKGDGKFADHKNRNGLDNRRSNLRAINRTINRRNHGIQRNNTSGYNGVHWDKKNQKWQASIKAGNKPIYLGQFLNIDDAAEARQQAEIKYWEGDL